MTIAQRAERSVPSESHPSASGQHRIDAAAIDTARLARVRLEELLDECVSAPSSPSPREDLASVEPVVLPTITDDDLLDDECASADADMEAIEEVEELEELEELEEIAAGPCGREVAEASRSPDPTQASTSTSRLRRAASADSGHIAAVVNESRLAAAAAASAARQIVPVTWSSSWSTISSPSPSPSTSSAAVVRSAVVSFAASSLGSRASITPAQIQAVREAREAERRALAEARRKKLMLVSLCCFAVAAIGVVIAMFSITS